MSSSVTRSWANGPPDGVAAAPLAVVSAMREEIGELREHMSPVITERHAGRDFHRGELHGVPCVLVLSGVGKVAAAATTAMLLDRFRARAVVFTGTAGGLGPAVRVGDVVIARSLLQHDLDASPLFPRYEVPLTGRSHFETHPALGDVLLAAAREAVTSREQWVASQRLRGLGITGPRVHEGLVVSGDRFIATRTEGQALRSALPQALAVEMEGAALAQVCHDFGMPFAVVRSISDRADDEATTDFLQFVEGYASALTHELLRLALPRLGPSLRA
jgi:adenosylhomocysteine nucleosidase